MPVSLKEMQHRFRAVADPEIAEHSKRFFKTGPGEYAEGDKCLGIRVPVVRRFAREFQDTTLETVFKLLESGYHEERLLALIMMVNRFRRSDDAGQKIIYEHYLANTHRVNNWDLVDTSAHPIVGGYLLHRSRKPLYRLAKSDLLWDRRISIIATYTFIKAGESEDVLKLAAIHLNDEHDLMHKAVGWMLRELGKVNPEAETGFLDQHYKKMPRTMLRYAIEKYAEKDRQAFLQGLR
ncbi:MAG: DNA alkylation repair protein [Verrucomicrobiae bacterium]|nr:DNA alkylation repair protein [Verrucomicrobiae bacterium]